MIANRSEFLFLYDVKMANPNGDAEENIPRNYGGYILVSPQRLKRTIRDYLLNFKGKDVFIRKEYIDLISKTLKTKEMLYEGYGSVEEILSKCIDIRLFGGTFAMKKKNSDSNLTTFSFTGPVQFTYGISLHKAEIEHIKGTCVIPSSSEKGETKTQGTFTGKYVVPYALIGFWGVLNENIVAKEQEPFGSSLTEEDVKDMIEAMWKGTKNLISDSKAGQIPRFLMRIIYKEGTDFHIGRLNELISVENDNVFDIRDCKVNMSLIENQITKYKDKIQKIQCITDEHGLLNLDEFLRNIGQHVELERLCL